MLLIMHEYGNALGHSLSLRQVHLDTAAIATLLHWEIPAYGIHACDICALWRMVLMMHVIDDDVATDLALNNCRSHPALLGDFGVASGV